MDYDTNRVGEGFETRPYRLQEIEPALWQVPLLPRLIDEAVALDATAVELLNDSM